MKKFKIKSFEIGKIIFSNKKFCTSWNRPVQVFGKGEPPGMQEGEGSNAVDSLKFHFKIFSFDYLENFINFLSEILKQPIAKNENEILKLEKQIFEFTFKDKKLKDKKYISENNKSNEIGFKEKVSIRRKFVINCSKFIEVSYLNLHIYQTKIISDFNQILIYYMLNFYDIANRKHHPYFNSYMLIYFLSNKHYDYNFKRFMVSRCLANMDLLNYYQLIKFIQLAANDDLLSKAGFNLYYPYNPLKMDRKLLSKFFNDKKLFSFGEIIDTLNISNIPILEKFYLVENALKRWDKEFSEKIFNTNLLNAIKTLKVFENEFLNLIKSDSNYFKFSEQTLENFKNLKIFCEALLKFRFKTTAPECFYSDIPVFLCTLDSFYLNGRYIDDKLIFDDLFEILLKCSQKCPQINFEEYLEKFIELFPDYIIKIFLSVWANQINMIHTTKFRFSNNISILKSIIYLTVNNKINSEIESKFSIIQNYSKNLINNQLFDSIDEYVLINFYLSFIFHTKIIEINFEYVNSHLEQFLSKILNYLQVKIKLCMENSETFFDLMYNTNISSSIISICNSNELDIHISQEILNYDYNLDLIQKNVTIDYLYLMLLLYKSSSTNSDIIEDKIINLIQQIKNYKVKAESKRNSNIKNEIYKYIPFSNTNSTFCLNFELIPNSTFYFIEKDGNKLIFRFDFYTFIRQELTEIIFEKIFKEYHILSNIKIKQIDIFSWRNLSKLDKTNFFND